MSGLSDRRDRGVAAPSSGAMGRSVAERGEPCVRPSTSRSRRRRSWAKSIRPVCEVSPDRRLRRPDDPPLHAGDFPPLDAIEPVALSPRCAGTWHTNPVAHGLGPSVPSHRQGRACWISLDRDDPRNRPRRQALQSPEPRSASEAASSHRILSTAIGTACFAA